MFLRSAILALALTMTVAAPAQISMQESHSHASLRGIHVVNSSVAWASGTEGTVLRTTDGGEHWTKCAVPPDADKLDFRGISAWDDKQALAMSSGASEQSRLYRTTDGCATWTEVARNHEKDGFWDAIVFPQSTGPALLLGDPVNGRFETDLITDHAKLSPANACLSKEGEGAFAASNTSVALLNEGSALIGTGGKSGARVLLWSAPCLDSCPLKCDAVSAPMAGGTDGAGIFSIAIRDHDHAVAVGGDYKKPDDSAGTAAWSIDGGHHWTAATSLPHGYRSAVAWDAEKKVWIAVGTNGSDISRDDGKTWQALEKGKWNAIAPPFLVGPDGRIGKLGSVPPASR